MRAYKQRTYFTSIAYVCLTILATVVMTSVPASAQEGTLDRVLRDKKITIGWVPSPPQMMRDPATGELKGYFVEAARYIFNEVGVEPEFVETNFSSLISSLQSKQIDLSIASTFVTIKRAAVLDFTRPILYLGYGAVVRADETRFSSLADFNQAGIKIATLLGGSSQSYVEKNFPQAEIVTLDTANQTAPFMEVASGRADVGINDAWSAQRFTDSQSSVKNLFEGEPYNVQPTAWAVRKGDYQLLNFVNAALETLLSSGRFEEMAAAYEPSGRYKAVLTLKPFAAK